MTIDELEAVVRNAKWFTHLGEPDELEGCIHLKSLEPWASDIPSDTEDEETTKVADEMEWLPTSKDQVDPVHGKKLVDKAKESANRDSIRSKVKHIYKATLESLRGFEGSSLMKVGPHDFETPARGAVLYAVRQAAYEALVGEPGFWCNVVRIYGGGRWPCGLLPNGELVIY